MNGGESGVAKGMRGSPFSSVVSFIKLLLMRFTILRTVVAGGEDLEDPTPTLEPSTVAYYSLSREHQLFRTALNELAQVLNELTSTLHSFLLFLLLGKSEQDGSQGFFVDFSTCFLVALFLVAPFWLIYQFLPRTAKLNANSTRRRHEKDVSFLARVVARSNLQLSSLVRFLIRIFLAVLTVPFRIVVRGGQLLVDNRVTRAVSGWFYNEAGKTKQE